MKSPTVGKQRSASKPFSLSRALPKLSIPAIGGHTSKRPKPQVGKPPAAGPVKSPRNG